MATPCICWIGRIARRMSQEGNAGRGEGDAACWTCGGPHPQDACPHRVTLSHRTTSEPDGVDLLPSVEEDDMMLDGGSGLPAARSTGRLEHEVGLLPAGEGQTQERPLIQDVDGSTEPLPGAGSAEPAEAPPAPPRVIMNLPPLDVRGGRPAGMGPRAGRGGSQEALSSLDNSASSSSSFLHALEHPLGSLAPPPHEGDGDEGEGEDGERRRVVRLSRRSVSWADEACVVGEGERGSPSVHMLPLEQPVTTDSPRNRAPPPLPTTRPRNEFAVDTGRLSLLTLRYVVTQAWALTQVRLSLTLMLTGVALDCVRFWRLSLPLLLLLASATYLSQHHRLARSKRRNNNKAKNHSSGQQGMVKEGEEDGDWVRWALDLCSSERWRERVYDWFKQIFKDKNRVRVILLCLQVLPIQVQVYALVVLTLEIHQYPTLAALCFLHLSVWLVASKTLLRPQNYGLRTRVTKFGLFSIALLYLLFNREWICLLRLLGPTLITIGGVLFTTLPPDEIGMATRSAVALMLRDVMLMAKERVVTEHELIQVALNRWMLEYWDNPSDFTWEDFLPMMKYIFKTMGGEVPESTLPTLQTLARRLNHLHTDPLGPALVHRIRSDVGRIAPPKSFSLLLILSRASRHLQVLAFDVLVMGVFLPQYRSSTFPLALLPLLVLDVFSIDKRGPKLLKLLSPDGSESEALSMLLSGSEGLLYVWNNLNQALVACETGLKMPMVKVLDHSDRAEAFRHSMKAYQGMAKARAMVHNERKPAQAPASASAREWSFKSGWAMVELQRLRYCQVYEGAYDDAEGLYSRAMQSYIKWLVDAPGLFNNWLHSVMFTVSSAALPLNARGSIDLGDPTIAAHYSLGLWGGGGGGGATPTGPFMGPSGALMGPSSAIRGPSSAGGPPGAHHLGTPQAGEMLRLSPWVKRDTRFFVPTTGDPLQRSLSLPIESLPTPVSGGSARSAFWWAQAGGPISATAYLPSSPDTEDEEDEVSSGSYDLHGHFPSLSSHHSGGAHSRRNSNVGSPEAQAGIRNDRIEVMRVKNLFSGSPESVEVVGGQEEADDGQRVFSTAGLGERE